MLNSEIRQLLEDNCKTPESLVIATIGFVQQALLLLRCGGNREAIKPLKERLKREIKEG